MKNALKVIASIIIIITFILSAILNYFSFENNTYKMIAVIILSMASLIDVLVMIYPFLLKKERIKAAKLDSNTFHYNKKEFVDREDIYNDIVFQIDKLKKKKENVVWIMLHGEDGVGKKALISKLCDNYRFKFYKFFFIENEETTSLITQLSYNYPLESSNRSIENYSKVFASQKNVFVIITNQSNEDITIKVSELFEMWVKLSNKNNSLVIITFDTERMSRFVEMPELFSIFEYELLTLSESEAFLLTEKLLSNKDKGIIDEIVKASYCLPAAIKFISNEINQNGLYDSSSWLIETLKMRDSLKNKFFQLCVLTITDDYISQYNINRILTKEELSYFVSSLKILLYNNRKYYVPIWLVNQIKISGKYHGDFLNGLKSILKMKMLDSELEEKAKILIENDLISIYNRIEDLFNKKEYSKIKEYYYKLLIDYNYEIKNERKILLLFMRTFLILGEYSSFKYMKNKYSVPLTNNISEDDFEYNMLCADYYHLISQYSKSNTIYFMLRDNTKIGKFKETEIDFSLAHNFRHEGKFDESYFMFKTIMDSVSEESIVYKRALTGLLSIEYFKDEHKFDKDNIYLLYRAINQDDVKYNIIRHIANIEKRCNNDIDKAIILLRANLIELEKKNLRLLQDYYFEIGECLRLKCRSNKSYYNESLVYLNKALLFAEKNHDSNLHLSVQISKLLLQYSIDKNKKNLKKSLQSILELSKISIVIHYCVLTLLSILNETDLISFQLKEKGFFHYFRVLESKDITSIHITVM